MNKKLFAFTLIELLVVIAIIGILSGLIVVSMSGVTQKANIAKAQVFSNSLRNSLMANIVGEWKMDDGSGSVASDTWTKINNGNLTSFDFNTTTSGWRVESQCIFNGCLQFDGSNDWVDLDSRVSSVPTGVSNITVGAWVKWSSVPVSNQVIVAYGGNNSATGFLFQYESTYKMHMGIVNAWFQESIATL
ncbi:MAG: prepilin-type N-terminal cleavage/methylation domain-containing protein [Candidatus Paceibacterota bacterium]|jgi:prepilin-type N-terminal cleavage/methylation domain-containing protein